MRKPNGHRCSISLRVVAIALGFVLVSLDVTNQVAQAQTFTVLHRFAGFSTDGRSPQSALVRDGAGNLYGTTLYGGKYGGGTVFRLDTAGKPTILLNFFRDTNLDYGFHPTASLVRDARGNLYGTNQFGGDLTCEVPNGCGTVFKLAPTGTRTALHRFKTTDGAHPQAGLIADSAGNLYGTTFTGGDLTCHAFPFPGCGVVFKLDPTGKLTILHKFTGSPDGALPVGRLVRDAAGNLYGATGKGGDAHCQCGTIFKIDVNGTESVLFAFRNFTGEGMFPGGGLVLNAATGNLFGTTGETEQIGGVYCGTIFVVASGTLSFLHQFTETEGIGPSGDLILDTAGNLYGTTVAGGDLICTNAGSGCGTVFKWSPSTGLTDLYRFTGTADGNFPEAGLLRDAAGNLYGTASLGGLFPNVCATFGLSGCGVVFKITP